LTYNATSPEMTPATRFDLASLTKVMATTSATMLLYQAGLLELDWKVSDSRLLGADFSAKGKENITIRNLLMHNAGLPPDPIPQFWSADFACNQTKIDPPAETFDCVQHAFKDGVLGQALINVPGEKFVYSDLSMITMMFIVGKLVRVNGLLDQCSLSPKCRVREAWTNRSWGSAGMRGTCVNSWSVA